MGFRKNCILGDEGMAPYAVAILLVIVFFFFTFATWALKLSIDQIVEWDGKRTAVLKSNAQLDTIRYALIYHRVKKGEYPEKLSARELSDFLNQAFQSGKIMDLFYIDHYKRYDSYKGPSFKLRLRNKVTKKIVEITSFQIIQ